MAWIAVAGMGVSAAGKIFGAIKGGKANRANQRLINQEREENKAMFNNNASQDFLNTNAAKGAVKEMKQGVEQNQRAVAGRGAITGASDEAIVAGNTGVHKTFQDGLSRIASNATQYQTQQQAMYRSGKSALMGMQVDLNNKKAESAANLAENAGQLANGALMNFAGGSGSAKSGGSSGGSALGGTETVLTNGQHPEDLP